MINKYVIYGERHSGTKFLEKLISCFDITKSKQFGHKHFFRPNHILNSSYNELNNTLFLCIVRNPYDWLLAFHQLRHHCGISNAKHIYNFLSKEWWSRHEFLGKEILADHHLYIDRRYKNIFEMRTNKLSYLKNILPYYINNYILIRYEDFLDPRFCKFFINNLTNRFNLSQQHNQPIPVFKNKKFYYQKINDALINYINSNIDWTIENQIGYYKASSINDLLCRG